MTTEQNVQVSMPFPFLGILTLIFITLKLTGYIAWSWLWVLAPIWLPFALVTAAFLVIMIVVVTAKALR